MPSYILRQIDPTMWANVKARAEADQLSLRVVITELLKLYAAGKISIGARRS